MRCPRMPLKVRYTSVESADEAVDFMNSKTVGTNKPRVRHYYCHDCEGYHLTSQEKDYKSKDGGAARRAKATLHDFIWLIAGGY